MRNHTGDDQNTDKWISYARNWLKENGPTIKEEAVKELARKMPLHVAARRRSDIYTAKVNLAKDAIGRLLRQGSVVDVEGTLISIDKKSRGYESQRRLFLLANEKCPQKSLKEMGEVVAAECGDYSLCSIKTYLGVVSGAGLMCRKDGQITEVGPVDKCIDAVRDRNKKLKSIR